jgi:hypothetical protein
MFGAPKMPAMDQKVMGLKNHQLATQEQARPMPIFAGKQRMGSTWLCEPFNWNSSTAGLKTGRYVFASFALLHARGPVDKLFKILGMTRCFGMAGWCVM